MDRHGHSSEEWQERKRLPKKWGRRIGVTAKVKAEEAAEVTLGMT